MPFVPRRFRLMLLFLSACIWLCVCSSYVEPKAVIGPTAAINYVYQSRYASANKACIAHSSASRGLESNPFPCDADAFRSPPLCTWSKRLPSIGVLICPRLQKLAWPLAKGRVGESVLLFLVIPFYPPAGTLDLASLSLVVGQSPPEPLGTTFFLFFPHSFFCLIFGNVFKATKQQN